VTVRLGIATHSSIVIIIVVIIITATAR